MIAKFLQSSANCTDSMPFGFLTVNVAQRRGLGTVLDFSVNHLPRLRAGADG